MSLFTSVNIFLSFTLLTVHSTAPHKFTSKKQIFEVCFLEVLFIFRDDFINLDDNKPASFIFHNNFSIKPSSAAEKSTSVPSSRFLLTPPSSSTYYSSLCRIQVRVLICSTPGTLYTRLYRLEFTYILLQLPTTPANTRFDPSAYIILGYYNYTGYRLKFSYILLQISYTTAYTGYRLQFLIYSTPGTLYNSLYRIQVKVLIYSTPCTHYSSL